MKRILLLSSVASAALAYESVETVLVKGQDGKSLRVNKSDFDADQASDKPTMTEFKGADPAADDTSDPTTEASDVNLTGAHGVQTTAAPSAPNFGAGDQAPLLTDPVKQAAAPVATTSDQLLVMKSGTGAKARYFICDGNGVKIEGDRAKLLGIDEAGYSTEEAAKAVQSTTEPKPTP